MNAIGIKYLEGSSLLVLPELLFLIQTGLL